MAPAMTAAKARTAAEALLASLEAPLVLAAEPLSLEPEVEPDEPDEPEEPDEEPEEEPVEPAEAAEPELEAAALPVLLADAEELECEATSDLMPLAMVEVVWQFEVEGVE